MHIKDHATAQGWFRKHAAAPSSVGSWKAFVARNKKVQEPRITAQEPRIGLQGGQLVAPSVDGSRPGYGGDDTVVDRTVLRYKYDKSTKQKLKTIYKNIQKYKDIKTFPTAAKEAEIIERLNNFALDFKEATGRLPVANEIRSFGVASQSVTSGKKGTYLKEGKNFMTETAELLKSKTYVTAFTREEPIVKEVFNLYDEGMSKIAISEKLNVDRTKLRSWFHKWRPEDIGDENKTSGKGKWRPQKKRKKILADLKKELKGMEGGKDILAKMEAHLDDIWNKNDEILAMSDQQILKSKKIKQAMNLNVSNLKIGEGLNYDRYKNLSNADYVAKVRGMAETHQFYQPEHLIAINKKNVASLLPENIVSVSGKIGSQMETLKNYVTKNPKDKFVFQIDELFKSQGIPSSSNIIKLNKVTKPVKLGSFPANIDADMFDFRKLPDDMRHFTDVTKKFVAQSPTLSKAFKTAKGASKWAAWALAGEPAFAAPFAEYEYKMGESPERMLGTATFGLFGETEKEELKKATGELGYATQQIDNYGSQLQALETKFRELNDDNDPRGEQRRMIKNLYEHTRGKYSDSYNLFVDDQGEFDKGKYEQGLNNYTAGLVQIDKFKKQKQDERIQKAGGYEGILQEREIRDIKGYATGGLAGLMKKYYD